MMTSRSDSLRVFLNYAKGDLRSVETIYGFLTSQDIDVWFDQKNLLAGHQRQLVIEDAVKEADIIIVCLSSTSLSEEGPRQKEIRMILDRAAEQPEGTIFLIPFRLDDCSVPSGFQRLAPLDFFHGEWQEKLLEALRYRAKDLNKPVGRSQEQPSKPFPLPVPKETPPPASIMSNPPVGRFWPRTRKPIRSLIPHQNLPPDIAGNPFPYPDAEADSKYLFSRANFFWSGHPILGRLRQETDITVILGSKGAGKTALAHAFGLHLIDKYTLSFFFKQPLPFPETQSSFVLTVLDFITYNPFYLPRAAAEQKLLAEWLRAYLDETIISARISRAISRFEQTEWFTDAGPINQRQEWKKQAEKDLKKFGELVEKVGYRAYNKFQALNTFRQCVESLEFTKVRAVFDLSKNLSDEQFMYIQDFLQQYSGRAEIVVLAQPDSNWIDLLESGTFEELTWSNGKLLERMVRHRWGIVSKFELESLFMKGAFEYLLKCAEGNPGHFVRLWNKVLDLKMPRAKISIRLIEQAR